jgi:hypothetical protein
MVITNARALRLAETHGLAAPRLIAADLDGRASGTVATLETFLSGSSDLPPTVSVARLREAGVAIARVHAFSLESQAEINARRVAGTRRPSWRIGRAADPEPTTALEPGPTTATLTLPVRSCSATPLYFCATAANGKAICGLPARCCAPDRLLSRRLEGGSPVRVRSRQPDE